MIFQDMFLDWLMMVVVMMMLVVGLLHPCALEYTDSASVYILPTGLL
jgi:hypothetical protein